MRMRLATIGVLTIAMTCSSFAAEEIPGWLQRTFGTLSWEQIALTVDTPKEICAAVRHHVKYTEDIGDEWQSGEKTWERGTGDCEDYARTVVDLCAKKGIEAEIFFVYPRGSWEAHAVVVGKWKGNLWFSSNGWYERVDSWDDIKRSVARDAGWRGMEMLVKSEADALKGETVLVPAKTSATSVVLP